MPKNKTVSRVITINDLIRDKYDFSNAIRGKFSCKDAEIQMTVYLDQAVQQPLIQIGKSGR